MQTYTGDPDSLSAIVSDPSVSESVSFSATVDEAQRPKARQRVLIVDDHAAVRSLLRLLLEEHEELEIIGEAIDGEEAVTLAEAHRPDVVLMDIHLPRLNGVEATRRISRLLIDTAIIGISLEYSPYAYNAMTSAGAVAFVRKEDAVESLYKTIQFSLQVRRNRDH
ncbi:MAG TPA: response regulator transcription factor [Nitrospira sp.]|nr:response regulator transcription factor [Nitrospira sp.]